MKKVIVTIAACVVLCFGVFLLTGFSSNWFAKTYTLDDYDRKEFYMDAAEISKIQMDVESSNVEIISSDTDHIKVTYYNMDKDNYTVSAIGNEIIIQHNSGFDLNLLERIFGYSVPTKPLVISLPSTVALEFNAAVNGGKITAAGFYSDNIIKITADEADVSLTEISAESILVDAGYGDIKLLNTNSRNFEFVTDSADVTLDKVSGENINIKAEYGSINGLFDGSADEYTVTIIEDGDSAVTNGTGSKEINIELDSGSCNIDFMEQQ